MSVKCHKPLHLQTEKLSVLSINACELLPSLPSCGTSHLKSGIFIFQSARPDIKLDQWYWVFLIYQNCDKSQIPDGNAESSSFTKPFPESDRNGVKLLHSHTGKMVWYCISFICISLQIYGLSLWKFSISDRNTKGTPWICCGSLIYSPVPECIGSSNPRLVWWKLGK